MMATINKINVMNSMPNFLTTGLLLLTLPVLAQTDVELDLVLFDPILLSETGRFDVEGRITAYPAYQGLASLTRDIPAQEAEEDAVVVPDQEQVANYMARISSLEQEQGLFSPDLIQNLLALGNLHQQREEHEQAVAIFERADHISRINYGLYDAGQIPIVEGMVESFLALGDFRSVSDRQRYLYFLNEKLRPTGSIPALPSLTDMADNSMSILDQAMMLTNDYSQGPRFRFGEDSPGVAEIARYYTMNSLFRAKSNYAAAIASLIRNDNLEHPRLMELEYKHLETLFLLGFRQELIDNPHYYMTSAKITANQANRWTFLKRNLSGYETGVESFGRMLRYLQMDSGTQAEELVRTHLEFGDWHLLFGWGDAAAAEYEQAYARARELELSEEQIDSLFSPDFPRQLPLFSAKPNSREKFGIPLDEPLEYDGYIDIRFRINPNGTARDLRFLGSSPGTRGATQIRLKRYLKNSPFRPFLVDGKAVNQTVEMRYYYTFQ